MKVAIVHELLVKMGGAERVAKVFADMFPDAPVYTLLYNKQKCGSAFPPERVRTPKHLQTAFQWKIPRRMLTSYMDTAIESFDFSGYDVVLSSSSAFAHGILTGTETKHLCYCHSPARYLWDQTFPVQEQQSSRGILSPLKKTLLPKLFHRLRIWDETSAHRPDRILSNSNTVQKRVQHYWHRNSEVVFPPVRTEMFSPVSKHEDFFLIVSTLSAYKNIDIAVRVFSKLPKHQLVIIGDGAEMKRLQSQAGENIIFLGRKSDAVVHQYLENCRAFLFPGEDDFGIAPVEAMACGKPVIALNKGGATETIHDGKTGILFDAPTDESFEKALVRFFTKESCFQAQEIHEHACQFSETGFRSRILQEVARLLSPHCKDLPHS